MSDTVKRDDVVPLRQATRAWFLVSLQTFGGPAGQIAVMQRMLVDERRWIGQQRFLFALSYCTLLPGPEAQQLATYVGWLLNGVRGALVAGVLFVLPGLVAMLVLSAVYVTYGDTAVLDGLFLGLGPAVLAIVVQAVLRIARRSMTHPVLVALAVSSFVALAFFAVPFPYVLVVAAVVGWTARRALATSSASAPPDDGPPPLVPDEALHADRPSSRRTAAVLGIGLVLWMAPVALAAMVLGGGSTVVDQGVFFGGTAVISFGGAYAVLAFVAQRAVDVYGWLSPGEMVRGLALAETTPGPLVMVVQFVAFLGAYRDPGALSPWAAAVVASLVVTWVTFVPSFVFILLGAPYVERLRGHRGLTAALTGITAAVVGVIASLALYFAVHTLFDGTTAVTAGWLSFDVPRPSTVRWDAVAMAALGFGLAFAARWSVLRTLAVCAVLGLTVGVVRSF
ncbi:chromate efflux transporter [Nocardioides sp. C4-1]|uniref:chromate efflux transporter n=1 Tax=Nocardioides sp. C4-1 TaxID=3151851 RepID=UPI003267A25F